MNHKEKRALAKKMQTPAEARIRGARLFGSAAWVKRRDAIKDRLTKTV